LTHAAITKQYKQLKRIDDVAEVFFEQMPDADSLVPVLLTPAIVIRALENVVKRILGSTHCNAYLLSSVLKTESNSEEIRVIHKKMKVAKNEIIDASDIESSVCTIGIVGHVLRTKHVYILTDTEEDEVFNPNIDLDPITFTLLAVPIIDYHGTLIGCIEVAVDRRPWNIAQDVKLALRFTQRLIPPLQYALQCLGQPFVTPVISKYTA
jgi:hypothetical protein